MDEKQEKLVNEGKEFVKLRSAFKAAANPASGSAGNLISVEWINKYKRYI
jgi:hypothetical protein